MFPVVCCPSMDPGLLALRLPFGCLHLFLLLQESLTRYRNTVCPGRLVLLALGYAGSLDNYPILTVRLGLPSAGADGLILAIAICTGAGAGWQVRVSKSHGLMVVRPRTIFLTFRKVLGFVWDN